MQKNPCNVISKKFIVSMSTTSRFLFLKDPGPPVDEYDNIQQPVDARSMEDPPVSLDCVRDCAVLEHPPRGLEGAPPGEDQVHKHRKCPFTLLVIRRGGRAGSGQPLADFDRSVSGGK